MTLARLFDNYLREVTPTKSLGVQAKDRRTLPLLLGGLGASRRPENLNVRDWNSYIGRRRSGEIAHAGREGRAVRARMLEQDCKLLLAVLNWAERARDDHGNYLLERNPLRGLVIPREESPRRPIMTAEQFANVRTKAAALTSSAELFVCLLWFTGHRAASVRQLRWSDIDLARKTIHWRPEVDKIRYHHTNPAHAELVPLLEQAKAIAELTGDTYLFPSRRKPSEPMNRNAASCPMARDRGRGRHQTRLAHRYTQLPQGVRESIARRAAPRVEGSRRMEDREDGDWDLPPTRSGRAARSTRAVVNRREFARTGTPNWHDTKTRTKAERRNVSNSSRRQRMGWDSNPR
jgi:hypothetical protein